MGPPALPLDFALPRVLEPLIFASHLWFALISRGERPLEVLAVGMVGRARFYRYRARFIANLAIGGDQAWLPTHIGLDKPNAPRIVKYLCPIQSSVYSAGGA